MQKRAKKIEEKEKWKKDVCYIDNQWSRLTMHSRQSGSAIIVVYFLVLIFWEGSSYIHQFYRIKYYFF